MANLPRSGYLERTLPADTPTEGFSGNPTQGYKWTSSHSALCS
jgi:hypothetical protein